MLMGTPPENFEAKNEAGLSFRLSVSGRFEGNASGREDPWLSSSPDPTHHADVAELNLPPAWKILPTLPRDSCSLRAPRIGEIDVPASMINQNEDRAEHVVTVEEPH